MFTKKDFETTAKILRERMVEARDFVERDSVIRVAEEFADQYKESNPRFNRDRFLGACGL